MSDDWKVGDLALCIDASVHPLVPAAGLVEGAVYTVIDIDTIPGLLDTAACGLVLAELPVPAPFKAFGCDRFRKIRPDEHQACEEEFKILLKLSKKRVSA